ncbi:hypothetical protein P2Q00_40305 [Streptomyces coacervatus]|uniref:hypothetical protein n=1 Tax=Streptomyces coacervatus TaxID=647381 RepID=UPI0023DA84DB|nr:hypothetical protein [Streptomyces coacervatus]MDF2271625.1 hypothetical protein [Streptomyces coacervatus]
MHRTTTTATLLVTVAVSALTGCVTVQRPPSSGPPPAPPRPSAPLPDDAADPQIVQAPVHEALQRTGPSRPPARKTPQQHGPSAPAEQPTAPHSHPRPRPRAAHPESGHHRKPRAEVPDGPRSAPKNTDVCALGREYGGWRADSPEAVICKQAYGS